MNKFLSSHQISEFKRNGYISPVRLFDKSVCGSLVEQITSFEARRPTDVVWAFDIKCNLLFDWVYQLSTHLGTLDVVEGLLGPNFYNTNTVFRIKEPGASTSYGWHQDAARIDVDPCFLIVYVALTESSPENGGLLVIPGSHKNVLPFEIIENNDGQAMRKVARTMDVNEDQAVSLTLAPGEATIFSGRLVHGSRPNLSSKRRVSILTDYTAAHSRQSQGVGSGQLVRGIDTSGYITEEPVPVGDCEDIDVKNRREILKRFPENPLMGPLEDDEIAQFPDSDIL
ncbi:MAG: non-heme Fe2+,alpha-ketoglutarate-dependent halogenase [Gammaproteobacteria bacterium]|jgi:non-heme Fe2+,alpha-ketoglutarate-dependent halogenase